MFGRYDKPTTRERNYREKEKHGEHRGREAEMELHRYRTRGADTMDVEEMEQRERERYIGKPGYAGEYENGDHVAKGSRERRGTEMQHRYKDGQGVYYEDIAEGADMMQGGRRMNMWGRTRRYLGLNSERESYGASNEEEEEPERAGSVTQRNAYLLGLEPQIRRKIEVAQVYFMDYYFSQLSYIYNRRLRLEEFKDAINAVPSTRAHLEQAWRNHCMNETSALRRRRQRTREKEFDVLAQIGQGGYGKVYLARKRDTGEVSALKKMNKRQLFKLNEVQHVLTERDILRTSKSVWLVKLLYAFQDTEHVYLAMEYVPGGDVRTLLNSNGILLNKYTRFYVAEMFVAVSALHTLGYVHRDLKPENFMIDGTGHIKLTDFGLSQGQLSRERLKNMKEKLERIKDQEIVYHTCTEKRSFYKAWRRDEMPQAYSIVGSPDYMAPEILYTSIALAKLKENSEPTDPRTQKQRYPQGVGYDYRIDYWSLGCILYEFVAGFAPFTGPKSDDVWRNVYHWEKTFQKPDFETIEARENMTPDTWDMITRLISHADQRMASLEDAQAHEFFRCFDLVRMRENVEPPFVPELESEVDTAYFDDFSSAQNMDLYREVLKKQDDCMSPTASDDRKSGSGTTHTDPSLNLQEPAFNAFAGFTYRHNKLNNRYL